MAGRSGDDAGRDGAQEPAPVTVAELLARTGADPEGPHRRRRAGRRDARVHAKPVRRARRAAGWITGAVVAILVVTAVYYVGLFAYTENAVSRADVLDQGSAAIRSPQLQTGADNFLLVGTGTDADATVLVHLSPQSARAVLVSFPPDAYVDVPACARPDGSTTEPYTGRLDSAFDTAGAGCALSTVQLLTGIRIDHYIQMDFTGIPAMVDALGGLPVCVDTAPADGPSGSPAATTVLDGAEALDFVRAESQGGAADMGSAAHLHEFLTSMFDRALSAGTFVDAVTLTRFLTATAASLTLDSDTTFGDLKDLGDQLDELDPEAELFLTAPVADPDFQPVGSDTSYALLDDDLGRSLYDAMINNSVVALEPAPTRSTPAATSVAPSTTVAPTTTAPAVDPDALTVEPGEITVDVINGVGTVGLADQASTDLAGLGFTIGELENAFEDADASVVRYRPDQAAAARTLAAAVPGSVLEEDPEHTGELQLVVGSSYSGVAPVTIVPPPPPSPTTAAQTTTAPTTAAPVSSPVAPIIGSGADSACS